MGRNEAGQEGVAMTNVPLIRTRIIALARPTDDASVGVMQQSEGVNVIRLLPDRRHLEVTYDLQRVTLPGLVARLSGAGIAPANSLFARWSRAWIAFQDENWRDQAKIVHQCCNVPPSGK